jgi:hypothetical protein
MRGMPSTFRTGMLVALLIALAPWGLAACAGSRRDSSQKEWDRAQCNQIIGERERKRCLERVESE